MNDLIFQQNVKEEKYEGIKEQIESYSKRIACVIQFTMDLINIIMETKFNTLDFAGAKKGKPEFFSFLTSLSTQTPNLESKNEPFQNYKTVSNY